MEAVALSMLSHRANPDTERSERGSGTAKAGPKVAITRIAPNCSRKSRSVTKPPKDCKCEML